MGASPPTAKTTKCKTKLTVPDGGSSSPSPLATNTKLTKDEGAKTDKTKSNKHSSENVSEASAVKTEQSCNQSIAGRKEENPNASVLR